MTGISTDKAARIMGIGNDYARKLARSGQVRAWRVGSLWKYDPESCRQWQRPDTTKQIDEKEAIKVYLETGSLQGAGKVLGISASTIRQYIPDDLVNGPVPVGWEPEYPDTKRWIALCIEYVKRGIPLARPEESCPVNCPWSYGGGEDTTACLCYDTCKLDEWRERWN